MTLRWTRSDSRIDGPRHPGAAIHVAPKRRRKTVCENFDEQTELEQLRETIATRYATAKDDKSKKRAAMFVTRHLKRLLRCGGSLPEGEALAREKMGGEDAERAIADARTPLGGYAVGHSPWPGSITRNLERDGPSEIRPISDHEIEHPKDGWGDYQHRRAASKSAAQNRTTLLDLDVVASSGHHYNSHLAPGFFTNIETTRGYDLRYSLALDPAGFPEVAVVLASGCASLCRMAQAVLGRCFPNAWFFGAKNTMTLDNSKTIWPEFGAQLQKDATPLLLDNDQDLLQLAHAWQRACIALAWNESARILRHRGRPVTARSQATQQVRLLRSVGYGFAHDGTVHLLTEPKIGSLSAHAIDSDENKCQRKADDRRILPPPRGFDVS